MRARPRTSSVYHIRIKHNDITYTFTHIGPHIVEEASLRIEITTDLLILAPSANTLLYEVVEPRDPKLIQLQLRIGYNIDVKDDNSRTSISYAVEKGCEAIIILLAKNRADVNLEDNEGVRPLNWAVNRGHNIIMRVLLRYGANINGIRSDGAI